MGAGRPRLEELRPPGEGLVAMGRSRGNSYPAFLLPPSSLLSVRIPPEPTPKRTSPGVHPTVPRGQRSREQRETEKGGDIRHDFPPLHGPPAGIW